MPRPESMPLPAITFDRTADALAVTFARAPRSRPPTTRELAPGIRADYLDDRLLGFEILEASTRLPAAALETLQAPTVELTIAEAAKESRRKPTTLRNAIAAGRLEARKRGRDWLVARHALWNYIESLAPSGRPTADRRAKNRRRAGTTTSEA